MDARKLISTGTSLLVAVLMTGISGTSAQAQAGALANSKPTAPTITEPLADGQLVSAADVHMETGPFRDPDSGAEHLCSDWEIWTASPRERVWFSSCITGAQRSHVHLGDGVFENSFAGRADLIADRDYELRTRHRDNSGDSATEWSAYSVRPFRTDRDRAPLPGAPQWNVKQSGYVVEEVASGLQLPTNIAMVPTHSVDPAKPMAYITELYGNIKVIKGDFSVGTYARDLLDFDPNGQFPGSGEIGLTGIVVDPGSGDIFAAMLYKSGDRHYPKVSRFHSNDGGLTAASETTVLRMGGAPQEASHQISNLSIGPDGKLYVHMGDGFTPSTAKDINSFRGKVLRLNLDGSAPSDNPYYKASDGISARDYVFASGFRNPFGGAWRAADGQHYEVENGPSIDRLARVTKGADYGWDGSNSSIRNRALYNWDPSHAPVNITFTETAVHHAAGFPADKYGHAFVSESGPTYATGPQDRGKRIVEFTFNSNGSVSSPRTLVEYNGNGKSSVVGLAAGPDGLYFTSLYPDSAGDGPTAAKAKVYRVRYSPPKKAYVAPFTAYQNGDFSGSAQVLGTGVFEASKGEFGGVADNSISSLRVGAGFRVAVCDQNSSGGRVNTGNLGLCRYYGPGQYGSVGDLNDKISLITVLTGPSTPQNAAVAFTGDHFNGNSQPMGVGGYEKMAGELKIDGISSLQVAEDHRVVACEHDRSAGAGSGNLGLCRYFDAGEHTDVGNDLDNKISFVGIGGSALIAYRDTRSAGPSQRFGPGIYEAKSGQLSTAGNDAISALRVAAGYRLVACQHDSANRTNTGNLGLCRFYGPGDHNLVGTDPDDDISSLVVLAGPGTGSQLTGYKDSDYRGTSKAFGIGIYESIKKEFSPVGNDSISSLRVAAGNRSIVCADDSYKNTDMGSLGLCRFYAAGNHSYVGKDLNDRISLAAVAK